MLVVDGTSAKLHRAEDMVTTERSTALDSAGDVEARFIQQDGFASGPGNETDQMSTIVSNELPPPDRVLVEIADYVQDFTDISELAYETAHICLFDALGCAMEALDYPACTKLLGPLVPGTIVETGAKVPGTK